MSLIMNEALVALILGHLQSGVAEVTLWETF